MAMLTIRLEDVSHRFRNRLVMTPVYQAQQSTVTYKMLEKSILNDVCTNYVRRARVLGFSRRYNDSNRELRGRGTKL